MIDRPEQFDGPSSTTQFQRHHTPIMSTKLQGSKPKHVVVAVHDQEEEEDEIPATQPRQARVAQQQEEEEEEEHHAEDYEPEYEPSEEDSDTSEGDDLNGDMDDDQDDKDEDEDDEDPETDTKTIVRNAVAEKQKKNKKTKPQLPAVLKTKTPKSKIIHKSEDEEDEEEPTVAKKPAIVSATTVATELKPELFGFGKGWVRTIKYPMMVKGEKKKVPLDFVLTSWKVTKHPMEFPAKMTKVKDKTEKEVQRQKDKLARFESLLNPDMFTAVEHITSKGAIVREVILIDADGKDRFWTLKQATMAIKNAEYATISPIIIRTAREFGNVGPRANPHWKTSLYKHSAAAVSALDNAGKSQIVPSALYAKIVDTDSSGGSSNGKGAASSAVKKQRTSKREDEAHTRDNNNNKKKEPSSEYNSDEEEAAEIAKYGQTSVRNMMATAFKHVLEKVVDKEAFQRVLTVNHLRFIEAMVNRKKEIFTDEEIASFCYMFVMLNPEGLRIQTEAVRKNKAWMNMSSVSTPSIVKGKREFHTDEACRCFVLFPDIEASVSHFTTPEKKLAHQQQHTPTTTTTTMKCKRKLDFSSPGPVPGPKVQKTESKDDPLPKRPQSGSQPSKKPVLSSSSSSCSTSPSVKPLNGARPLKKSYDSEIR
jgi:hypothetical protein